MTTMNTSGGSATIHPFPKAPKFLAAAPAFPRRFDVHGANVVEFAQKRLAPVISFEAWYHEAALQESKHDH